MKSVVDFEKAKTTHRQTRVPARLTRGRQGTDRREWPKASLDRGASQCRPEKEHKNREAEMQRKPELTRCRESPQVFSAGLMLPLDMTRPWSPHTEGRECKTRPLWDLQATLYSVSYLPNFLLYCLESALQCGCGSERRHCPAS